MVPVLCYRPRTLDDVINQVVARILDQFEIDVEFSHHRDDENMSCHPDAGKTNALDVAKKRRATEKR